MPDTLLTIREWPADERPREKLFLLGEHRLTNAELLAILLRNGSRGQSALDLARRLLDAFQTFRNMSHTDARDWLAFKGLGRAKVAQIKAALEIGRRFREDECRAARRAIRASRDVADLMMPRMRDLKIEIFKVLLLDNQNRILKILDAEEGTVGQAAPVIREICQQALQHFAAAIICVHNHPSGTAKPSPEDSAFTRRLCEAGKILQLRVLDHIIIGDNTYYSFAESGTLDG